MIALSALPTLWFSISQQKQTKVLGATKKPPNNKTNQKATKPTAETKTTVFSQTKDDRGGKPPATSWAVGVGQRKRRLDANDVLLGLRKVSASYSGFRVHDDEANPYISFWGLCHLL